MFADIAQRLIVAGADAIIICSNTPHMIADQVAKVIDRPLIHIAEETAKEISNFNLKRVGLLGTRFTMEQSFFIEKLTRSGIKAIVPEPEERTFVHQSIFNELSCGIYNENTKQHYIRIIDQLKTQHIQGLIFGCSEISLLIDTDSLECPVFDTTRIHALAAVEFVLN
jgi:aspartate racemase